MVGRVLKQVSPLDPDKPRCIVPPTLPARSFRAQRTGDLREDLLVLLFRRAAVIISVVAMCATPALAKRVGAPASPEENVSRTQPHTPAAKLPSA